jgi:hypothetical protein
MAGRLIEAASELPLENIGEPSEPGLHELPVDHWVMVLSGVRLMSCSNRCLSSSHVGQPIEKNSSLMCSASGPVNSEKGKGVSQTRWIKARLYLQEDLIISEIRWRDASGKPPLSRTLLM